MYQLSKLAESCTHDYFIQVNKSIDFAIFCIDSRKIIDPTATLFIALKTTHRDGHDFIETAYKQGVRQFLIENKFNYKDFPEANFLIVKNCTNALQEMAAKHRSLFKIPVIGITGSNGKTIVKEWLYQILSNDFNVVRSPMSYNSQIGVPLSVLVMNEENNLGIFEAGVSQPFEMNQLERIIQPSLGIFTHLGDAHNEGFKNAEQKLMEKLQLFKNVETLIYSTQQPQIISTISNFLAALPPQKIQTFTWGSAPNNNLIIKEIVTENQKTTISVFYNQQQFSITIPFTDAAYIENVMHCWATLIVLKYPFEKIKAGLENLHAVAMRLELKEGRNNCTLINDAYNSDTASLLVALDFLKNQKQQDQHTVILSDLLQTGLPEEQLYNQVIDWLTKYKVNRFIGIGTTLYRLQNLFKNQLKISVSFFKNTADFIEKFEQLKFQNEAILIKGARTFEFEKISQLLALTLHSTTLTIQLTALLSNLSTYRKLINPGVKTMAMVKAFSYGSGSYEIAQALQQAGVDYLAVAYIDEGVKLREAGIQLPIMVMSPEAIGFDRMIAWNLEPEIFNLRSLESFTKAAASLGLQHYPIHIKLDTGMHRLGFEDKDVAALNLFLKTHIEIKVASIFSHLAGSESDSFDEFTNLQAQKFEHTSQKIIANLNYQPLRHLCNSSAIPRHKNLHFDMVRLGLGLYGIDGSNCLKNELKPISSLKTIIAQIKEIKAGETIGYGRKGLSDKDLRIATVSIGYADGYPRSLGNGKAYMLINGERCAVIGVVCMDMCMIDITHLAEVNEGDEVLVFGENLPLTQLAKWADTIPYEIMTGISQRVKRVYIND